MAVIPQDLDTAVREWFASHGLEVHETYDEFDHDFFAWRHSSSKRSVTLWISRTATEDYPPRTLVHMLRDFEPDALMDKFKHAHLHVATHEGLGAYARERFSPTAD